MTMVNVRQPLFSADGLDEGGWDFTVTEADPVDDVQPDEDTDTEVLEEEEISEDVVEPDAEEEQEDEEEQPAFDDETEIALGDDRQPVKLAELKQGYMRQSDYTKKTQALADDRKAFDAEKSEWEPVKGLNDFLQGNPYLAQQINRFVQDFSQTGAIPIEDALADAEYGQYINTLMSQAQQLQKRVNELESQNGELEFTGNMRDLKTTLKDEYKDLYSDEYFATLQERGKAEKLSTGVLKDVADAHFAKLKLQQMVKQNKKTARDAQAKTIQNLHEKRTSLPANPKKPGQTPKSTSKSVEDMSWDEIFRSS